MSGASPASVFAPGSPPAPLEDPAAPESFPPAPATAELDEPPEPGVATSSPPHPAAQHTPQTRRIKGKGTENRIVFSTLRLKRHLVASRPVHEANVDPLTDRAACPRPEGPARWRSSPE